ncbi:polysaccharide biosynthesis tyrosine autokinase [Mycobacterium sp. 852014-52144_SCH5372336]|uniref:polysaccharide biosynthesis tyrosine autokinase n=1 Tax=Mycobacterium sp. 852014-52144_SCH5372336 TaxID=1834115 RepID=UPI0007FBB68B|nr:polysaccharide biosynthesis tyrosine autokinase [Mycobacterium sp. 852014-52144_SCH5372336]OBB73331.1 hypothetical protein A5759_15605 [Mycobacterium sp. 852014-52144_SCH5372336]
MMHGYEFARRWWPVALCAVLGIAAGLALSAATPKSYTATTTFFLGSPASADSSGAYNGDLFSQQRSATYSQLAGNRDLGLKVIDDLALPITPDELATKVTASQVPKTVLLQLSVTDGSAQRAADIANSYGQNFPKYVARLETPAGSSEPVAAVDVIQEAEAPASPTAPKTALNAVVGLAVGLFLGLFINWLRRIFDRRVRTEEQVENATGTPILGTLPKDRARSKRKLDPDADAKTAYAESIRELRTNLLYVGVDAPPKTIAFVTPSSSMSTTATAANLAVALDGINRYVALIDADLRSPRLTRYLGVSCDLGLTAVIDANTMLDDVLVRVPTTGIDLVPADSTHRSPGDVLASDGLAKLIAELGNSHDFVFCDSPDLETANDATVIALACDGVILTAVQGKTKRDELSAAAQTLRRLGANVLGAVLTDVR